MRPASPIVTLLLAAACLGVAPGEDDDRGSIRALDDAFVQAFNAGDARAIAGQFAEDARIVDEEGRAVEGRAGIESRFAATFAESPGATIALKSESLRVLAPDVAEEEGVATITPADGGPAEVTRYSVVFVKRDGRWLHASVRDLPAPAAGHHERLEELEWLVGDWVSEGSEAVVTSSFRWDEGGNFLLRTFTVQVAGQKVMSGTERIGWDPLARQIRSWAFDSDGGFGDGLWTREDDRTWVVKASGVRSDGRVASATRVLTRVDAHRSSWTVRDRVVGGRAVTEPVAYAAVRTPPEPK